MATTAATCLQDVNNEWTSCYARFFTLNSECALHNLLHRLHVKASRSPIVQHGWTAAYNCSRSFLLQRSSVSSWVTTNRTDRRWRTGSRHVTASRAMTAAANWRSGEWWSLTGAQRCNVLYFKRSGSGNLPGSAFSSNPRSGCSNLTPDRHS